MQFHDAAVTHEGDPLVVPATPDAILQAIDAVFKAKPTQRGSFEAARVFPHGVTGKRIIYFASKKNGDAHMMCEGAIQAHNCLQLEFSSECAAYRTEPFTMVFEGRSRYTPDTIVRTRGGRFEAIECKPEAKLRSSEVRVALERAYKTLADCDIPLHTFTENDFWPRRRTEALSDLYHHVRPPEQSDLAPLVRDFLAAGHRTVKALRAFVVGRGFHPRTLEYLIWTGIVSCDLDRPITPKTEVRAEESHAR